MSATAFPLAWPPGFPRSTRRDPGKFKTTLEAALKNVESSLRLFGTDSGKPVTGIIISSNYTLGTRSPADPGVAVYFTWDGMQVCIPVDRYASLAANLQAIHHIVEAGCRPSSGPPATTDRAPRSPLPDYPTPTERRLQ